MTMFDERERAFESLFAHEEELRFLVFARRNELFGQWAAEQIGLRGAEYRSYIRSFATSAALGQPESVLIERVREDLEACGIEASREGVSAALSRIAADAARRVRTEIRVRA